MIPYDKTLPVVFLKPGEMFLSEQPTVASTVLGSCVSITMYSRTLKIGAICHGLLPTCNHTKYRSCGKKCTELYKYVDCAFRHMVRRFQDFALSYDEIEVKLFGGSEILVQTDHRSGVMSVGEKNIRMARDLIRDAGFTISASDTGGLTGRKLYFLTHSGEVFLKHLKNKEIVPLPLVQKI